MKFSRPWSKGKPKKGGNKKPDFKSSMSIMKVPRTMFGGYPDRAQVTLRYATRYLMTTTTIPTYVDFRANSVYDPDYTGGGAQPAAWDDWISRYQQCWVTNCRVKVHTIATAAAPLTVALFRKSVYSDTLAGAAVQPYSRQFIPRTTGGADMVINMSADIPKMLGIEHDEYIGNTDYACGVGANPTYQWFWSLVQESYDSATSSVAYYQIELDYDCVFGSRIEQTLSIDERIKKLQEIKASYPPEKKLLEGVRRLGHVSVGDKSIAESKGDNKTEAKAEKTASQLGLQTEDVFAQIGLRKDQVYELEDVEERIAKFKQAAMRSAVKKSGAGA
jgi:hypothetical protein